MVRTIRQLADIRYKYHGRAYTLREEYLQNSGNVLHIENNYTQLSKRFNYSNSLIYDNFEVTLYPPERINGVSLSEEEQLHYKINHFVGMANLTAKLLGIGPMVIISRKYRKYVSIKNKYHRRVYGTEDIKQRKRYKRPIKYHIE